MRALAAAWRPLLFLVGVFAAAGCFSPDLGDGAIACSTSAAGPSCPPDYDCVSGKCRRHGGAGQEDGGIAPDMSVASVDMAPPPDPAGCDRASHVCLDTKHSAACVGGLPMPDRTCPPGSLCLGGTCQPPVGSRDCNHTNGICQGAAVCIGYNVRGTLRGFCTDPVADSTLGEQQRCAAAGYDDSCQTGLCVATARGNFCGFPCVNAMNCGALTGAPRCEQLTAPSNIEGVSVGGIKVCTPP